MNNISPPPIIKKFNYKSIKQVNSGGKRFYEIPDGSKTPSVSTILSATKDMTALNAWKKRVGTENAKKIKSEAAGIGTAMHANIEKFLLGEEREVSNQSFQVKANAMAQKIIENGLKDVNEVWGIEQALYFPYKYSGTADLIGEYKNMPAIMDFKQSNKPKKKEWIGDYFLQLTAYRLAHNEVYKTNIKTGVIFVCTRDEAYQQFDLSEDDCTYWEKIWWDRVDKYYQQTS